MGGSLNFGKMWYYSGMMKVLHLCSDEITTSETCGINLRTGKERKNKKKKNATPQDMIPFMPGGQGRQKQSKVKESEFEEEVDKTFQSLKTFT